MKKNMVRVLAFVLVLILALGIIPLGALAAGPQIHVPEYAFNKIKVPIHYNWGSSVDVISIGDKPYNPGETIKTSDYDAHYLDPVDGKFYDFSGFGNHEVESQAIDKKIRDYEKANAPTSGDPAEIEQFEKNRMEFIDNLIKNTTYTLTKGNIEIDPYPVEPNPDAPDKAWEAYYMVRDEWHRKYDQYFAAYTPHQHSLSYWYSDSTTHWRECLVCRDVLGKYYQFMDQNWHSDGDEDRICDVCGADIPYHEIEVIDSKGGKITVNLDEAPHRRKITATVDVEDGYKLKKLHFTKVRDDGSKQEITRRKKNGEFWTYMPTYDLEVTAEYVKKN